MSLEDRGSKQSPKPWPDGSSPKFFGLLREVSNEMPYQRYVDGRRRRCFPESSIMTRPEYERWRSERQEQRPPRHDVEEDGRRVAKCAAISERGEDPVEYKKIAMVRRGLREAADV